MDHGINITLANGDEEGGYLFDYKQDALDFLMEYRRRKGAFVVIDGGTANIEMEDVFDPQTNKVITAIDQAIEWVKNADDWKKTEEEIESIRKAASVLGRKGGSANTDLQNKTRANNGRRFGGRKKGSKNKPKGNDEA